MRKHIIRHNKEIISIITLEDFRRVFQLTLR